jgi:hypothetical protein
MSITRLNPNQLAGGIDSAVDIASLLGWWKADSLGLSDGTAVSSWTDSSGNGKHLVQATGSKQPLLKTAILNGLPVIRFDGTDDALSCASFARGAFTMFVVLKTTSQANTTIEHSATSGSNAGFYFSSTGGANFAMTGAGGSALTAYDVGLILADSATRIITESADGTDAGLRGWVNGHPCTRGTSYGNANPGAATVTDTLYVGGRGGTSRFTNGDIAEIIIYGRVLARNERQAIEDYLARKYALAVI